MGDMKSPLNTFSDSAKKNKSEVKANSGVALNDNNPLKAATPQPKYEYTINPAIFNMLEKMATMQKEIDDKIDEAIHKHGITRNQLDNYLNDPKNFTKEQLDYINTSKNTLLKKVGTATNLPESSDNPLDLPSTAKRGKVKSIGTRRNWIPTR